jgi:DNA polymerase V
VIVPLRRPTADTALLVQSVVKGMRYIYQPGFQLIKAGVMLLDLSPDDRIQGELDLEGDVCSPQRERLMTAMDGLNTRFGKGTVHVASAEVPDHPREWGMRQERSTPQYTTRWAEVPVARA